MRLRLSDIILSTWPFSRRSSHIIYKKSAREDYSNSYNQPNVPMRVANSWVLCQTEPVPLVISADICISEIIALGMALTRHKQNYRDTRYLIRKQL